MDTDNNLQNFKKHKIVTIIIFFAYSFVLSVSERIMAKQIASFYQVYSWITAFSAAFVVYTWYFFDRQDRGQDVQRVISILFLFVGIFFLPLYLLGSRSKGKRGLISLKLIGFIILFFVLVISGNYLGIFITRQSL